MALPVTLSSFVGRERELDGLVRTLAGARLVTLTGAGGTGKTRLAIELARRFGGDDVPFVDLAGIPPDGEIASAIARTVGAATVDALAEALQGAGLLVIDNAEHVVDHVAPAVEALLGACPALRLLVTSRQPLGAAGETVCPIPPMVVPRVDDPPVAVLASDAARLLVERASAAGATLDPERDAALLGALCRQLDGLPLAVELAAAHSDALSLADLLTLVSDQIGRLPSVQRTAPDRHRSLTASLSWSHDLLTETERRAFRSLAAFPSSFDLEAARAVVSPSAARDDVPIHLAELVRKSLVVAEPSTAGSRFRLLESVREFAGEQLRSSDELEQVHDRHAAHYLAFAERAAGNLRFGEAEALGAIDQDYPNLLAAFTWFVDRGDAQRACRFVAAMGPVIRTWGSPAEGERWAGAALPLTDHVDANLAVRVMGLAARSQAYQGAYGIARQLIERGRALAADLDDPAAAALRVAEAEVAIMSGDLATVRRVLTVEDVEELGDMPAAGIEMLCLAAAAAVWDGALAQGEAFARKARDAALERGLLAVVSEATAFVGSAAWLRGDRVTVEAMNADLALRADETTDAWAKGFSCAISAFLAGEDGRFDEALQHIEVLFDSQATSGLTTHSNFGDVVTALVLGRAGRPGAREAAQRAFDGSQRPDRNTAMVTWSAALLAQILELDGDWDEARAVANGSRTTNTGLPDRLHSAVAQRVLGRIERHDTNLKQAGALLADALDVFVTAGAVPYALQTLLDIAGVSLDLGDAETAARVFGAAEALHEAGGHRPWAGDAARAAVDRAAIVDVLGPDPAERLFADGAAMSLEEAAGYVRRGRGPRRRPPTGWDSLTPVESDVANLVAAGLGNDAIAAKLFVSRNTVKTHLQHIYAKLGLASRGELVAAAARRTS